VIDDDEVYEVRGYLPDEVYAETAFTVLAVWRAIQTMVCCAPVIGLAAGVERLLGISPLGPFSSLSVFVSTMVILVVQYRTWKKYSGTIP
jgi:hypothetical protein